MEFGSEMDFAHLPEKETARRVGTWANDTITRRILYGNDNYDFSHELN